MIRKQRRQEEGPLQPVREAKKQHGVTASRHHDCDCRVRMLRVGSTPARVVRRVWLKLRELFRRDPAGDPASVLNPLPSHANLTYR